MYSEFCKNATGGLVMVSLLTRRNGDGEVIFA
jgi:hypothetical protein